MKITTPLESVGWLGVGGYTVIVNRRRDMDIETARKMLAAASRKPWELRDFGVKGKSGIRSVVAEGWLIAEMVASNPLYGRDQQEADSRLIAQAPATLAALILAVEALEENATAERHVLRCESCDAGALNFCLAGQDMLNAAGRKESEALAAWEKL